MSEEIWKDIPGYGPKYQASTSGNIRELKPDGIYVEVKQILHYDGYLFNYKKDLPGWSHKLIATTFLPKPEGATMVDHLNNVKYDNRVENLEWVTHKENMRRCRLRKTTAVQTPIRCVETQEVFKTMREAAARYNIRYETMRGIVNFSHLPVHGLHFERVVPQEDLHGN